MPRSKIAGIKEQKQEIDVSVFKRVHIHFPGDVYLLAVWVAMSDRTRSTPTCRTQTTLSGLAKKFVSTYGMDYSNPLDADDVMAVFRKHGIKGNPGLLLGDSDGALVIPME